MTTINTIEDLHKILTENAHWREAIRAALLGDDLLQLPAKFDRFAEQQQAANTRFEAFIEQQQAANACFEAFIARVEAFIAEQRAINARFEAFIENQEAFNAEQREFNAEQRAINAEQRAFNAEQRAFNAEQRAFNARFEAFIERQETFNAEQRAINARFEAFIENQEAINARFEAFIERQEAFNAEQQEFNAEMRAFKADQQEFNEKIDARTTEMQADIKRLDVGIGELKGQNVHDKLPLEAPNIAMDLGLSFIRYLDRDEIRQMALTAAQGQALTPDLKSFRSADLIIEASDRDGQICYIPVEASYTLDRRDTDRAIRNAAILTQLTGKPAKPAVFGVRYDHEINPQVQAGQVFLYETEPPR